MGVGSDFVHRYGAYKTPTRICKHSLQHTIKVYTCARTHTHIHTHTHTHSLTQLTNSRTLSLSLSLSLSLKGTHAHTHTHTHARARVHTRMRTPPLPNTHTCCHPQQLTGCGASRAAEAAEALAVLLGPRGVRASAHRLPVGSAVILLVSAVSR